MKTLKFIVTGQDIALDPKCDISGLVPGTSGYVKAQFSFSKEWDGCLKVAGFYSNLGREFKPCVLKDGKTCEIPAEALEKSIFKIRVFGTSNGYDICTNDVTVYQKGGRV